MNRNSVEARLEDLKKGCATIRTQIEQFAVNLHATEGAIQDCEHWLAVIAEEENKPNQPE
jgi:septal ring factor EnvC (AmiA/AmiB activator)